MKVDFDPIKNERNINERQLSFERVVEVDCSAHDPSRQPAREMNECLRG